MNATSDPIVAGRGAVGSASLMQLARRGQRVLGLDRWDPPHAWGSTHGETRITRCAVGEGEQYVPLVQRSHEIWRELEALTGTELLTQCGALIMARGSGAAVVHGKGNFVRRTIAAAERFAIPHEVLDAGAIGERFPQFRLRGDEIGYFEPGGGYVRPERCVAAQLTLARRHSATVRVGAQVIGIEQRGGGVRVTIAGGERFHGGEVVLAAGGWSAGLLGTAGLASHLTVVRQVLHWFPAAQPCLFGPERFPVFIWLHGSGAEDGFYGFPALPGTSEIKVATETYANIAPDPDELRRDVTGTESAAMYRDHVAGRLPGVLPPALRSIVCPYTNTPDGDFLIDRPSGTDRVLLVSACSGHGFKHSAGLGEAIADALTGSAGRLAPFGAGRLAPAR